MAFVSAPINQFLITLFLWPRFEILGEIKTWIVRGFVYVVCTQFSQTLAQNTAQKIAENAFASVVLLVMADSDGRPMSLGSGFCVGEDVVASNFHVVAGSRSGYAKIVG